MRLLRLILVSVFVIPLALIGFFYRPRQRDEEKHDDAAAVVIEEKLEDSDLETVEDDSIRRWAADVSPTRRGRMIRRGYAAQMFRPLLPWVNAKRRV